MMKKLPPVTAPSSQRPKNLQSLNNTFSGTARSRQLRHLINDSNASHFLQVNESYILNTKATPKDIEQADLSTQLKMLRKDYDRQARSSSHHEQRLVQLRQQLLQLDNSTTIKLSSLNFTNSTILSLQEQIKKTLKRQKMEENNTEIYKHILDRMRTTSVHLTRKSNKMKNELKNRDLLVKQEVKMEIQANTAKSLAKNAFKDLKNTVKQQKQIRLNDVEKLRSDISQIQTAKLRKEMLSMEQKQKLEQALIKESSQQAQHLKQGVYLNRLWYFLINKRFQKESKQWQVIQNAFQQIKVSTGLNQITKVVEKFLTKQQTLDELMTTVRQKEAQLEQYKSNIQKMQENIDLFVVDSGSEGNQYSQIQEKLHQEHKNLREIQEKHTEIKKTHQKILSWLQKILQRINANLEQEKPSPNDLVEAIQMIREAVQTALGSVSGNKQQVYDRLAQIKSEKLSDLLDLIPKNLRIKTETLTESEDDLQGLDFVDQQFT